MRRPPHPFAARSARGGITWVTALLLVALAGGVFLGWTWVPVYIVHYEVKQVVRDFMNQAVKEPNDQRLVEDMLHKLRVLDQLDVVDQNGQPAAIPTVQLAPEDVTWERNTSVTPATLHVAFAYTRPVPYPLIGRWTQTTLSVDLVQDLARPDWGPQR